MKDPFLRAWLLAMVALGCRDAAPRREASAESTVHPPPPPPAQAATAAKPAASSQPSATEVERPQVDRACAFEAPAAFEGRVANWIGDCLEGKAHGRGALRAYDGKRVVQIFFGRMERGEPKLGVIDEFGSFVYGEFVDGKAKDSDEYGEMLEAFEEAIAAAKEVSESFREQGNTASAEFYAKRAANLDQQLH